MSSRVLLFLAAAALLLPGGCASQAMRLVNPGDQSPRLAADQAGVSVTGGGSGSSRGWDRRILVSLAIRNGRAQALRLARKDLILRLGFRGVSAHTLIGSEQSGPVEAIHVAAGARVEIVAQFSTALAMRKEGKIVLRFREEGSDEVIQVEVPVGLHPPPPLLKAPGTLDRAGGELPDSDQEG